MRERNWKEVLREWFQTPSLRYTVISVFMATVGATLTVLVNPTVESENVRAVLTTLATAQASILAIVFSVTVVALQLVVTRYSARLTSLFVQEPLFRTTFLLFVGTIMFNLFAVYLLSLQSNRIMNAAVGIAFALTAVSIFVLYRFIQMMIQRSSPDNLISVLVERELAPEKYLPPTVREFTEMEVHPVRPLYRTIARAIELGEYQTAEQGIYGLRTVLTQTFKHIEREFPKEDAAQYASAVSGEVLLDYVPPILEQAYSHEQYDLVSDAVDDVEAIAIDGLDRGFTDVTENAAEGLGDTFDAAPLTREGNRLRRPVKELLFDLTKATASEAEYTEFLAVSHHIDIQMTVFLRRRPEPKVTDRLVGDYYRREVAEISEIIIDRYAEDVRGQDINWISPTEGRNFTLPDEAQPLRHVWKEYVSFTQTVLRYRVSENEYPFVEGSIDEGWKRITEHAADAGIDDLATLYCITTIQLAYRVRQLENSRLGRWAHNLGRLRRDYDQTIVDRAFALLKEGVQPEGGNILVRRVSSAQDNAEVGFFERILSNEEKERPFEEWLVEFEKEVHERTESLRKRE